jgi:D-3-phosphoglycerate dehydrogenase / 2-oxoglutarate reductase
VKKKVAMHPSKPTVLLVEPLASWAEAVLAEQAYVAHFSAYDEDTLTREIVDADGVIIRAKGHLTQKVLAAASRLRVIGRHGTGVDHIDLNAAVRQGIMVVNTPEANYRSVAEFTVGLILALCRRIPEAEQFVRAEHPWREADRLVGSQLYGKVVGIVGMGRVGRAVAQICGAGLGMEILYYDYQGRYWSAPPNVTAALCTLDTLLARSDIVTLHVPLRPATWHLLHAQRIKQMQPSALLINTSRGAIVDEEALVAALERQALAGAALDVMEIEPLVGSRLQQLPNVVLTPHIASYTEEAFRAMGEVVFDVLRVLNGEEPRWRVA